MKQIIILLILLLLFTYTANAALTDGLVSYYSLDTGTGDSKNINNGTAINAVLNTTDYKGGTGSYYFSGAAAARIQIPYNSSLSFPNNFTISIWFKTTGGCVSIFCGLWHHGSVTTEANRLMVSTGGSFATQLDITNETECTIDDSSFVNGSWHNIMAVYNSTHIAIFHNGNRSCVQAKTGVLGGGTSHKAMGWGQNVTNYYYFNGNLDEIGLWNRSLSISEIAELYNSGNGLFYPFSNSSSIGVINNTYSGYSINITADIIQACGYSSSGTYLSCGPTEDETPTFRFSTQGAATCKVWNESKNYSSLAYVPDCQTTGSTAHVCSFPAENLLRDGIHTLYASCRSGLSEINNFTAFPSNKFNVTINKIVNASLAMQRGINGSVIWPGATIYDNQPVYVRTKNDSQAFGIFDKVAVYGNQRWAFYYKSLNESALMPFFNISPVFYFLYMENITTRQITDSVGKLINTTKT
jgi:hypothetical protein